MIHYQSLMMDSAVLFNFTMGLIGIISSAMVEVTQWLILGHYLSSQMAHSLLDGFSGGCL